MIRKAQLKDVPTLVKLVAKQYKHGKRMTWYAKLCIIDNIKNKNRGFVIVSDDMKGAAFVDIWKKRRYIHVEIMISPSDKVSEEMYTYLQEYCKKNKLWFRELCIIHDLTSFFIVDSTL